MIGFQYKTDCGFRAENLFCIRTAIHARNRLVFYVVRVRVRALYERALRRVHTEAVNVYVTVSSPFSVLPLFGGDGNLNVRGSH